MSTAAAMVVAMVVARDFTVGLAQAPWVRVSLLFEYKPSEYKR